MTQNARCELSSNEKRWYMCGLPGKATLAVGCRTMQVEFWEQHDLSLPRWTSQEDSVSHLPLYSHSCLWLLSVRLVECYSLTKSIPFHVCAVLSVSPTTTRGIYARKRSRLTASHIVHETPKYEFQRRVSQNTSFANWVADLFLQIPPREERTPIKLEIYLKSPFSHCIIISRISAPDSPPGPRPYTCSPNILICIGIHMSL